jgi:hypothetical protein
VLVKFVDVGLKMAKNLAIQEPAKIVVAKKKPYEKDHQKDNIPNNPRR